MYNNNSNFYTQCCCYPENWNYHGEYDEHNYRDDSRCDGWDNRTCNKREFGLYERGYNNNNFDYINNDDRNQHGNYEEDRRCSCSNYYSKGNKLEENRQTKFEKRGCGCCFCRIFRICR